MRHVLMLRWLCWCENWRVLRLDGESCNQPQGVWMKLYSSVPDSPPIFVRKNKTGAVLTHPNTPRLRLKPLEPSVWSKSDTVLIPPANSGNASCPVKTRHRKRVKPALAVATGKASHHWPEGLLQTNQRIKDRYIARRENVVVEQAAGHRVD